MPMARPSTGICKNILHIARAGLARLVKFSGDFRVSISRTSAEFMLPTPKTPTVRFYRIRPFSRPLETVLARLLKHWSSLHAQPVDDAFDLLEMRSFMVCQPLGIGVHGSLAWLSRPRHRRHTGPGFGWQRL
jgi:hypothetical protein